MSAGVASTTGDGRYRMMPAETVISFAIPFGSAIAVADRIRKGERCDRGFLGV